MDERLAAHNDRDFVYVRNRPVRHQVAQREWVCGICESRLKTVWSDGKFFTVCAKDRAHSPDRFIHQAALEKRIHSEQVQGWNLYLAERRIRMGLKDRDSAMGTPLRMRLGRIGRVRQGILAPNSKGTKSPRAVDYFILDPTVEDPAERQQILEEVRAAIDKNAPGQDLEKPTVLPVLFLANNDDIIAPESYKVRRGKAGTVWCAGDGEYIQWKLSDDFRVEIAQGHNVDTGEAVPCPGGRETGRHPWCADCSAELEINFAIMGYERTGVWMIRTKSMTFRDQFWTQIGIVRAMAERGIVPGLVGVPFLLRRRKETVLSPVGQNGGLVSVEMPLTTIEIHPAWFQEIMRDNPRLMAPSSVPPAAALPPGRPVVVDGDYDEAYDVDVQVVQPQSQAQAEFRAEPGYDYYPPGEDTYLDPDPKPKAQTPAQNAPAPQARKREPNPAQGSGNSGQRPYTAALCRAFVRKKSGVWQAGQDAYWTDATRGDGPLASQKQANAVVMLFDGIYDGMPDADREARRHGITEYLVGVQSSSELLGKEASAIINLWKAEDSWKHNEWMYEECEGIYRLYLETRGQMGLPLDADPVADVEPDELDEWFPREPGPAPAEDPLDAPF